VLDKQRIGIGVGVHGHRPYAKLPALSHRPQGDFATIGHQDLLEHCL